MIKHKINSWFQVLTHDKDSTATEAQDPAMFNMFQNTANVLNFKNHEKMIDFESFYKIFRAVPLIQALDQKRPVEPFQLRDVTFCFLYRANVLLNIQVSSNQDL